MTSLRPLRPHQAAALDGATEHWLPAAGYEGFYEVSNFGRIRSVERDVPKARNGRTPYVYRLAARVLSQSKRGKYPSVSLYRSGDGSKRRENVHVIVAKTFLGAIPAGMVVCHNDGDPSNNQASNLRFDTPANNSADMAIHGTLLIGTKNHLAKLNEDAVREIRRLRGVVSQSSLGERFGVTKQAIGFVQRRAVWRHIP